MEKLQNRQPGIVAPFADRLKEAMTARHMQIRDTAHHTLLLGGYILRLDRHFEPPKVPKKAADIGGLADIGG